MRTKACITLYTRLSVRLQFLVCATPPTVSIGIRPIRNLPRWYPVISTRGNFDTQSVRPLFWSIRYPYFFLQKKVVLTLFIFPGLQY